jgi:putative redox protein
MVKVTSIYRGQKRCQATHEESQTHLETDAPKDNHGLGATFSPTDLVATSLGSCILTTIAIVAERDGISIVGGKAIVEKHMANNPRRISALVTVIELPNVIPLDYRKKIENVAHTCPVKKSLHPDVDIPVEIRYV